MMWNAAVFDSLLGVGLHLFISSTLASKLLTRKMFEHKLLCESLVMVVISLLEIPTSSHWPSLLVASFCFDFINDLFWHLVNFLNWYCIWCFPFDLFLCIYFLEFLRYFMCVHWESMFPIFISILFWFACVIGRVRASKRELLLNP